MKKIVFLLAFLLILLASAKQVLALPDGFIPTPEVIHPQSSMFCTDFEMNLNQSDENAITGLETEGQGTSLNEVSGNLTMDKENMPDFSYMEKNFQSALPKLLPQDLLDILSIEGNPLVSNARHFVMGVKDGQLIPPEEKPETEVKYPQWWTSLLGQTKIMCGIFGTCKAPKSPIIKVNASVKGKFSPKSKCITGVPVKETGVENLTATQTRFRTQSTWSIITKVIEKIVAGVTQLFTKKEKSTKLVNKTRGYLAGGETFSQQNPFDVFVPEDLKPEGKGAILSSASFNSTAGTIQEKNRFSNKGRDWFLRCMQVCSLYPKEMVSSVDPLCRSCDAKDYAFSQSGIDDPYLDMSLCQKTNEGGNKFSCDYCIPLGQGGIGQDCNDPVCEGDKCCPMQFRQAKDYAGKGCPLPYATSECADSSVCRWMNFEKNPDGGFGACQYQNSKVCVRADREEVDSCAATCNAACCVYQTGDWLD